MNRIKLDPDQSSDVKKSRVLNFVAKIVCIVFAFLIWFYVYSNDTTEQKKDFTVNIEIKNEEALRDREGWSMLSGKGNQLELTLVGKKNVISNVKDTDVHAYVDLSTVTENGEQELKIIIDKPTDCSIYFQSSTVLYANIDKTVTKDVKAKVDKPTNYGLNSNYSMLYDEDLGFVSVQGPEADVNRVASARALFDFGNTMLEESTSRTTYLELIDKDGNVVDSSYISINNKKRYSVTVEFKLYTTKEVPLKVAYKNGNKYFNDNTVLVNITPEKYVLLGEKRYLDPINEIILDTLDEKKYAEDGVFTFSIVAPTGVFSDEGIINPGTATVEIKHINTKTKTLGVTDIQLINSSGIECSLITGQIDVTLRGPAYDLSLINADSITCVVDMQTYTEPGEYQIPVEVRISGDNAANVYEIGTYKAEIKVGA